MVPIMLRNLIRKGYIDIWNKRLKNKFWFAYDHKSIAKHVVFWTSLYRWGDWDLQKFRNQRYD